MWCNDISLSSLTTFSNGDLNVLGPFIPFASPMDASWLEYVKSNKAAAQATAVLDPGALVATALTRTHAFECVLKVFQEEGVGLVVRLNEELWVSRVS